MSKLHLLLVSLLLATAATLSTASNITSLQALEATPCDLDAPENFAVSDIGATWVSLHWSFIVGAEGYKIKTFNSNTGLLVRETSLPSSSSTVTITGLDPGTDYRSVIASICEEGMVSSRTNHITFKTFILDLVVTGFTQSSNNFICTIGVGGNSMCTFPLNGTASQFLLTNGYNSKVFALQFVNGTFSFILQNTAGSYQFWGINSNSNTPIPAPAYNINHVFVTVSGSGSHIADLYVEKGLNGEGQLKLGDFGIAEGYVIHRIKWNGPEIPLPESFGSLGNDFSLPITSAENRSVQASDLLKNNIAVANPFHEQITLKFSSTTVEDPIRMQLFDLQGRLILSQENSGGEDIYFLPTEQVAPGMYLLRVEIGAYLTTLKLLKV